MVGLYSSDIATLVGCCKQVEMTHPKDCAQHVYAAASDDHAATVLHDVSLRLLWHVGCETGLRMLFGGGYGLTPRVER